MVYIVLLVIHIAAGSIALLAVPVALLTAKGRTNHVLAGRVYTIAMAGVFVTALPLAVITSSVFLLFVAVFSFYMVFAGWRFARNRRGGPHPVDWAAAGIMALTGLGMWGYSASLALAGDSQWMTMALYGAIALSFGLVDMRFHFRPAGPGFRRITRHLTNMLGATIATVTAVMVVNVDTDPVWIPWILPTVVITPLIVWWNFRVAKRGTERPARG
jgi:uncharacterized membrane protein